MSPFTAAALSLVVCCLPGLAQFMLGQHVKGALIFVIFAGLGFGTGFFSAPVGAILIAMDAYAIASKLQRGRSVGQWEFF
jgi:TM2 domain-containing membrane protein YozV